jgi:hypothetical protein
MGKKVMPYLYILLREKLRANKDFTDCMGRTEIKMILCRNFHVLKQDTDKVFRELESLEIIELVGRNELGLFYKIN